MAAVFQPPVDITTLLALPLLVTLCVRVELLVANRRLNRILQHRRLDSPFREQSLSPRINHRGLVLQHGTERGYVPLLKLAHPRVVAGVADSIDRFFRVGINRLRTGPFLYPDRTKLQEAVHPRGPEMLFTARFVVTEDAWREHTPKV